MPMLFSTITFTWCSRRQSVPGDQRFEKTYCKNPGVAGKKTAMVLKQFEFFKGVHKVRVSIRSGRRDSTPGYYHEDVLRQKLEYIHYNPVRIGLVDRPEDWRYSSARNYLGRMGCWRLMRLNYEAEQALLRAQVQLARE